MKKSKQICNISLIRDALQKQREGMRGGLEMRCRYSAKEILELFQEDVMFFSESGLSSRDISAIFSEMGLDIGPHTINRHLAEARKKREMEPREAVGGDKKKGLHFSRPPNAFTLETSSF